MAREGDKERQRFGIGVDQVSESNKRVQRFQDASSKAQTFKKPRISVSPSDEDQPGPSTSSDPTYARGRDGEAEEHDEFDPYLTPPRRERDAEMSEDEAQAEDRRPEDYYRIASVESRYVRRFQTQGDRYVVQFNDINPIMGIEAIIQTMGMVFESLLERMMSDFGHGDFVGLTIRFPGLEEDFWLEFTRCDALTSERLLEELERVLQSNQDVVLDGNVVINVTRVRMDEGGRPSNRLPRGVAPLEKWLGSKKA